MISLSRRKGGGFFLRLLKERLITKAPRSGGANAFVCPFLSAQAVDMGFGLGISIGILILVLDVRLVLLVLVVPLVLLVLPGLSSAPRITSTSTTEYDRVLETTPRGFEPLRAEPNGFQVHLLSRSDTVS